MFSDDDLSTTSSERRAIDQDIKDQVASLEKTIPMLTSILGSLLAGYRTPFTLLMSHHDGTILTDKFFLKKKKHEKVIPKWLPFLKKISATCWHASYTLLQSILPNVFR